MRRAILSGVMSMALAGVVGMGAMPALAAFEMEGDKGEAYNYDEVVDGYGSNMPVELIAQEVIPEDFEILFDSTVDRTARTSWYGGRPWPEIMIQALQPIGLSMDRQGNQVIIAYAGAMGPADSYGMAEPDKIDTNARTTGMDMQSPAVMGQPAYVADAAYQQQMQAHMQANMQAMMDAQMQAMMQVVESTKVATEQALLGEQVAAADAEAVAEAPQAQEWAAESGTTLRAILEEWSEEAGWALAWQSDRDYPLRASATFYGDFETAASNLIRAFSIATPPVRATIYRGNRVLVVTSGADRER